MVNLADLTQEQLWGVQFARTQANEPINRQNEVIELNNASLPSGVEPQALLPVYTDQSYIDDVVSKACDSYYKSLILKKEQLFKETFYALPVETQNNLMISLGVPNVIDP